MTRLKFYLSLFQAPWFDVIGWLWHAVISAFWSSLLFWVVDIVSPIGSLCYWSAIMLFDSRHSCVRNFNSVISIDVIRNKSNVVGFSNPSCVTGRVVIYIPNLVLNRNLSCFIGCVLKPPYSECKQAVAWKCSR